jgi:hypothetical protein
MNDEMYIWGEIMEFKTEMRKPTVTSQLGSVRQALLRRKLLAAAESSSACGRWPVIKKKHSVKQK